MTLRTATEGHAESVAALRRKHRYQYLYVCTLVKQVNACTIFSLRYPTGAQVSIDPCVPSY